MIVEPQRGLETEPGEDGDAWPRLGERPDRRWNAQPGGRRTIRRSNLEWLHELGGRCGPRSPGHLAPLRTAACPQPSAALAGLIHADAFGDIFTAGRSATIAGWQARRSTPASWRRTLGLRWLVVLMLQSEASW